MSILKSDICMSLYGVINVLSSGLVFVFVCIFMYNNRMIPGSKGLKPHELAHKWVNVPGTDPDK